VSIETKVVAEFYARLHPWIDHGREVLVCRDDGGASEAAIPDLCFHFQRASAPLSIEFKTFYPSKGGIIGCTNKQMATWSKPSTPRVAPQLWVAVEKHDSLLLWEHDDQAYQQNLTVAKPTSKTHYHVRVPTQGRLSFTEAFLGIMRYAVDHRFLL
jgi:hypothetical protein